MGGASSVGRAIYCAPRLHARSMAHVGCQPMTALHSLDHIGLLQSHAEDQGEIPTKSVSVQSPNAEKAEFLIGQEYVL